VLVSNGSVFDCIGIGDIGDEIEKVLKWIVFGFRECCQFADNVFVLF
jgi:hypothetical protein